MICAGGGGPKPTESKSTMPMSDPSPIASRAAPMSPLPKQSFGGDKPSLGATMAGQSGAGMDAGRMERDAAQKRMNEDYAQKQLAQMQKPIA